jgi:hypothetical protein
VALYNKNNELKAELEQLKEYCENEVRRYEA